MIQSWVMKEIITLKHDGDDDDDILLSTKKLPQEKKSCTCIIDCQSIKKYNGGSHKSNKAQSLQK